jgi:(p)ppGpp synthase/HD superfamily hydrolase
MDHEPRVFSLDEIRGAKLKELSPPQLEARLFSDLDPSVDEEGRAKIGAALEIMHLVHGKRLRRDDTEETGHSLRVANRIVTYFEVRDDPDAVIAALLHDTVERDPHAIAALLGIGHRPEDVAGARESAFFVINEIFGDDVSDTVRRVTTPLYAGHPTGKNTNYWRNIGISIDDENRGSTIMEDPRAFIVKMSDVIDNGNGVEYTNDPPFIMKIVTKLEPVYPAFAERLMEPDIAEYITPEGRAAALSKLEKGALRHTELRAELAANAA